MDEQRKRLHDLIVDADNEFYRETPTGTTSERIEKIADYLLTNGVIVPPCEIGDKLYRLQGKQIGVHEASDIKWHGMQGRWELSCTPFIPYAYSELGKTVFLTREEAEAALAERQMKETE